MTDSFVLLILQVRQVVRPHIKAKVSTVQKKAKQTCPECGKDIHDPDCAFNTKNR